jgi:peptidyl-prolyl cis-trans isomerase SurA
LIREIILLKLPEQNQTKKETRANGGSIINPKHRILCFELTKWIQVCTVKFQAKDDAISQPILDTDENERKVIN